MDFRADLKAAVDFSTSESRQVIKGRLTALSITFGALFLVAGVGYYFAEPMITVHRASVVETLVGQVLQKQKEANTDKKAEEIKYVYFPSTPPERRDRGLDVLDLSPPTGHYTIEAFRDDKDILVIRAFTRPDVLKAGQEVAVLYEHRISKAGEDGQGSWKMKP